MATPLRALSEPGAAQSHLGYWVRVVGKDISSRLEAKLQRHGVSVSEWLVLRELYRVHDGSGVFLAYRLGMTRGAVSKLIVGLQAKYFIAAATVTAGRRDRGVSLSPVGRSLVPTLEALAREVDEEFFGYMPRVQREQIRHAMEQVARRHRLKPAPPD